MQKDEPAIKKDQEIEQKILRNMKLIVGSGTLGTVLIYLGVHVFFKVDVAHYFPFLESKKVAAFMVVMGIGLELYTWILMRKIKHVVANIKANKQQ